MTIFSELPYGIRRFGAMAEGNYKFAITESYVLLANCGKIRIGPLHDFP